MRALLEEEPYRGRFAFEVFAATSPQGLAAHRTHGFGPDRHGLVVFSAGGRAPRVRPGHEYGIYDIQEDLDAAAAP